MWHFLRLLARSVLFATSVALLLGCGSRERSPERDPAQTAPGAVSRGETAADPIFRNIHSDTPFVGDEACFDCHEDEYTGYLKHGMARSYYPLTPENAVEDFKGQPVYDDGSDLYYRAFQKGGAFFQEETRRDDEGRVIHRLVRRMDFVMGSGNAARTYLTEANGRLYEMPLTWYAQRARWALSPGYEKANKRFDRLIPDRCMACHNGYPESVPHVEGKYSAVPHGIGCERCHGPGALHVDARLASPEPPDSIDATIVNPAHLSLDRQLDVCQQCHLQTTVSILREGRGPFEFRPSEPLDQFVALFSSREAADPDDITVISHADRMKQSSCFIATQGTDRAMTCVTCHDPHQAFRDKGPEYFNRTCRGCHDTDGLQSRISESALASHTSESNCTSCHMPHVAAGEAPHASFTDHRIRVVADGDEAALPEIASIKGSLALEPYFDRDRGEGEGKIYEGLSYLVAGTQRVDTVAMRRGISLLEEALANAPGHDEARFQLGLAYYHLGDVTASIAPMEEAVRLQPDVPERLNALALAYEAGGRNPLNIDRLYRRALSLQPAMADVRVNFGRFLERQGRLDEAVEQYRRAIDEDPWLAAAHYNLGTLMLRKHDATAAEESLLRAVELDPDYAKALGNLGLLYASRGELERAQESFERAVRAAPSDATALGNLGSFFLNNDELPRAIELLERAVSADPGYVDGLVNLALAHFRNDEFEAARESATRALDLDPTNARALQILQAL